MLFLHQLARPRILGLIRIAHNRRQFNFDLKGVDCSSAFPKTVDGSVFFQTRATHMVTPGNVGWIHSVSYFLKGWIVYVFCV